MRSGTDAKSWEEIAPEYISFVRREKNSYLRYLIYDSLFSNVFSFLNGINDKAILDAGCGEGRLARLMAEKGAQVHGCDVSETMISEANLIESEKNQGIKYFIHDLTQKLSFEKKYDIVVCNLVLFNIYDYKSAIKNISNSIKARGRFIFSILHPCFNSTQSQWYNLRFIGKNGGMIVYNIKKSYKEPGVYKKDYFFKPTKINYYHRPIEAYVSALAENNLYIDNLSEPVLRLDQIYDEKTYHQHFLPRFMIINSVKFEPR